MAHTSHPVEATKGVAMNRTLAAFALAVGVASTSSSCIIVGDGDATLTVHNHSSYVLTEVRIAEVGDRAWGPNLLPDVLYPGEDLVIVDIDCGDYDVLVVDETDVECVLGDITLCFDDERWVIDDVTLAFCAFH
jgi:hypothetical protein